MFVYLSLPLRYNPSCCRVAIIPSLLLYSSLGNVIIVVHPIWSLVRYSSHFSCNLDPATPPFPIQASEATFLLLLKLPNLFFKPSPILAPVLLLRFISLSKSLYLIEFPLALLGPALPVLTLSPLMDLRRFAPGRRCLLLFGCISNALPLESEPTRWCLDDSWSLSAFSME